MCGRYYRRSDKQRIAEAFKVGKLPPGFASPPVVQNASTRNGAFCACALDITTNAKTKIAAALRYLCIRYFAAQWIAFRTSSWKFALPSNSP
jgi:hypothetical protein